jgi:hypothetical protein
MSKPITIIIERNQVRVEYEGQVYLRFLGATEGEAKRWAASLTVTEATAERGRWDGKCKLHAKWGSGSSALLFSDESPTVLKSWALIDVENAAKVPVSRL